MLTKSLVFLLTLTKHVLHATDDECKLLRLIVRTLRPADISSPTAALVASSCADVLYRLWNSFRNNYTPAH